MNSREWNDILHLADPRGSVESTVVHSKDAMFEFLMMALRTSVGFSIQRFSDIFGRDPATVFGDLPAVFPDLLGCVSGYWRPSDQGLNFLNRVLVAALEAAELDQELSCDSLSHLVGEAGNGGFPS